MQTNRLLACPLALALLALCAGTARAHGSTQPPPGSGVISGIPDPAGPAANPFGGAPAGAPASGPSAPGPGGNPGGNPGGGGGGGGVTVPTGGGPSTGVDASFDTTHWSYWWDLNKEPYLAVRSHVRSAAAETGDGDFFLGEGAREAEAEDLGPAEAVVLGRIVPALRAALDDDLATSVRTGALIALARIGDDLPGAERSALEAVLLPHLQDVNQEVAETACVALGVLGLERSVPLLGQILRDDEAGRKAVSRSEVPVRTRAFAAYALGLVAHETPIEDVRRFTVGELVRAFEEDRSSTPDTRAACILALGLAGAGLPSSGLAPEADGELPGRTRAGSSRRATADEEALVPPSASRAALVAWLLEQLDDDSVDRVVRAQVPLSLARLVGEAPEAEREALKQLAAPRLVEHISPRSRSSRGVMQSCAIGLGGLGDADDDRLDAKIRKALTGIAKVTPDHAARNYSLIACGRVGARSGDGDTEQGVKELRRYFDRQLVRGKEASMAYAVLGAGLMERGLYARQSGRERDLVDHLTAYLKGSRAPDDIGATSLALGLARAYADAEEVLLEKLAKSRSDRTRGFVGLGLALMGSGNARDTIREIVTEARYQPLLLMDTATALAVLGDRDAVPLLVEMLQTSSSLAAQASIAASLGRIGDQRSVDPLLGMLADETLTEGARAYAAVALGRAADADLLPWNTPYAVDSNVATAPVTLYDGAGSGLLNIL